MKTNEYLKIIKSFITRNVFNIGFIIVAALILCTPIIFTQRCIWDLFDFSNTGEIGDTIGGITSPFINLFAAYLIFKSFMAQVKANEEVQVQIKNSQIEFEDNFKKRNFDAALTMYNMLFDDIKNFNVTNTSLNGVENFKSFISKFHLVDKEFLDQDEFVSVNELELQLFSGIQTSFSILCKSIGQDKFNDLERNILIIRITFLYNYVFNQIISGVIEELHPNKKIGFSNELLKINRDYRRMLENLK